MFLQGALNNDDLSEKDLRFKSTYLEKISEPGSRSSSKEKFRLQPTQHTILKYSLRSFMSIITFYRNIEIVPFFFLIARSNLD